MRDRLSHTAEGLCNMQIFSSFIALLIRSIISAGSCSMWPVSQCKSAFWTSCWYVFAVVQPDNRRAHNTTTWHTQSEGEVSKVKYIFHQPPNPLFIHKLMQCPKWGGGCGMHRMDTNQKLFFFLRTDFSPFSPGKNSNEAASHYFFNTAYWLPSASEDLACPPGCFRKYPFSAHLELISLIKEWLYRKEFLKLYSNSELQELAFSAWR